MSMPSLPHNSGSSKSLLMFGSDGMGSLMSASNQLVSNLLIFIFNSILDGFLDLPVNELHVVEIMSGQCLNAKTLSDVPSV